MPRDRSLTALIIQRFDGTYIGPIRSQEEGRKWIDQQVPLPSGRPEYVIKEERYILPAPGGKWYTGRFLMKEEPEIRFDQFTRAKRPSPKDALLSGEYDFREKKARSWWSIPFSVEAADAAAAEYLAGRVLEGLLAGERAFYAYKRQRCIWNGGGPVEADHAIPFL